MTRSPFVTKLDIAKAFLRQALEHGPRSAAELEAEGLAKGIKHSTLQTARERLKITSKRKNGQWLWIPPKMQGTAVSSAPAKPER